MVKKIKKQAGFSLLEVLIALTIFSVFIVVYVTSQGYNLSDSALMREEIMLRDLCEKKINEVIVNPPIFEESLTLTPTSKTFDEYPNYEFKIEYKRLEIPDVSKIMGDSADEEGGGEVESASKSAIQKKLFETIKTNMEDMIWQVKVTVINKETEFYYELSTWLMNHKAKVSIGGF